MAPTWLVVATIGPESGLVFGPFISANDAMHWIQEHRLAQAHVHALIDPAELDRLLEAAPAR